MVPIKQQIIEQIKVIKESRYKEYNASSIEKFLNSLKGYTNLRILYGSNGAEIFSVKDVIKLINKNTNGTKYYIWNYKLDNAQENLYNSKLQKVLTPLIKKRNFVLAEKEKYKKLYLELQKPEDKEKKKDAYNKFREYEALAPQILKKINIATEEFNSTTNIISKETVSAVKEKMESIRETNGFDINQLSKVLSTFTPIQKKVLNTLYISYQNNETKNRDKEIYSGGNLD